MKKIRVLFACFVLGMILAGCALFRAELHATTHTVRRGETLGEIAQYYYGVASKVDRIIQANPGIDPDKPLKEGSYLNIPAVSWSE